MAVRPRLTLEATATCSPRGAVGKCDYTTFDNTKVRRARTGGVIERVNRTLLDEHVRVKDRTTSHMAPEEIQRDLDVCIAFDNEHRTQQGYRLKGSTPAQALGDALGVERLPAFDRARADRLNRQARRHHCRGITELIDHKCR